MKIKLVTGATTYEAAINTIKQIDCKNLEVENLVVVPDSFSLQAENLIFDVLNIKSTLNIEVVGISRLASKILRNNNVSFKRISSLEEIFSIFKVIVQNENNFKYFKKIDVDFCVKILQVVKQFKACKIKSEQIKFVGDRLLDDKLSDIKLIYEKFDEELGEKFDLSKLLDFFAEEAENFLNLSKINLFFINFDSFSSEINSFICKLAKQVNLTFIGMARPISPSNGFIYEDDIFKKTTQLAKEYQVSVEVENFPTLLTGEHLKMAKNLFAFNVESGNSDFFVNVLAKNKLDEANFVAKLIKNKLFDGARLKDFAVAVADENYFEVLGSVFDKFGISYYCDNATDLTQTFLGRTLIKLLEISKLGLNKAMIKYIVNLPLNLQCDRDKILSEIEYFNVEDREDFLQRYCDFSEFVYLILSLKNCEKMQNYVEKLKKILDFLNFNAILDILERENLFKELSQNRQSKDLILSVFDKLCELGKDQNFDFENFEMLLKLAFKSVKVETIPAYIDAVFVGDATTSYFEDVDTLFVLGANAGSLPRVQNDVGIIDDDDIKKMKINYVLEPEIKVLNRRSRLKIFEMLQHAKNKLIVCSPVSEDSKPVQKAGFVNDLLVMFGNNTINTASLEDFQLGLLSRKDSLNKLLFYVGCQQNLPEEFSHLKASNKLPLRFEGALQACLNSEIRCDKEIFSIENLNAKQNISASELETYFSCPFKRFINYVLKIRPNENIEPNKRLFGIFEHALLQKFFEDGVNKTNETELELFVKQNVCELAKKVYNEKIIKRKYFIKFLQDESLIILKNVVKEQQNSEFKPVMFEYKITQNISSKKLVGFVDRVDKSGDWFRIVDYKTGKTENILKDLFYGKKLQLFLYASAIEKQTGLKCGGVYYFDCQTKYAKIDKNALLFNGLTKKDDEVVLKTDKRLWQDDFRSDLIGMSRRKTAKEDFNFKNGNAVDDFEALEDYATQISIKAINEIDEGYIQPKPYKDECKNCAYLSVCRYSEFKGTRQFQPIKETFYKDKK